MSLDKAIKYGKEHRKEFRGSKAFDKKCRCNGACEYCKQNRLYKNLKKEEKMLDKLKDMEYT